MLHTGHRLSKDIDIFIEDPQYLSFLSPRLGGEDIWNCDTFDESANHLKLIFPEGEIDFIVAGSITNLPSEKKAVDMIEIGYPVSQVVDVEHPVEIALKKLAHRGGMLKVRDIFDIAVVDHCFSDLLRSNLAHVAHSKANILARLNGISETFLGLELNELAISQKWQKEADACLARVKAIIAGVSEQ